MSFSAADGHALTWQTRTDDAIESISTIVPEAGVVVVLDGLQQQRTSGPGQSLGRMLEELGVIGEGSTFGSAWEKVSRRVGMSDSVAFDHFFGSRAVFVSKDLTIEGGQWAIASVVEEKLAVRLIKRLEAKGRDTLSGQTIFAIENGAYRLSPVQPGGVSNDLRLLVIAPRASAELFETLVAGLSDRDSWASVVGERHLRDTVSVGVLRAGGVEVARFNLLLNDEGWQGQARLVTPGLMQETPGFSGEMLDRLGLGGWLVLGEELDAAFLFRGLLGAFVRIEGDLPERLSASATDRVIVSIRPARGGASIMVGVEMMGADGVPELADEAMRDFAVFLTSDPDTAPRFDGFMPRAARSVRLRGALSDDVIRPMLGEKPNLSWLVRAEKDACWWVFRLGGETGNEGASLREFSSVLPARESGGRLAAVGMARPAPIAGLVHSILEGERQTPRALEWIETVRWSSKHQPGQTEIGFSIVMKAGGD